MGYTEKRLTVYSFKELVAAGLIPNPNEEQEYFAYRAQKRRRTIGLGEGGPIGESTEVQSEGFMDTIGDPSKRIAKAKAAIARGMPKHVAMSKYLVTSKDLGESTEFDSEEQLDEVLDPMQRMKRKQLMRRLMPRLKIGRERAKRKTADLSKLKKRAQKRARSAMFKKLAQGKDKDKLSYADRKQIEKRLESKKGVIDRMAKKLLPQVRKDEQARKQMVGKDK